MPPQLKLLAINAQTRFFCNGGAIFIAEWAPIEGVRPIPYISTGPYMDPSSTTRYKLHIHY